MTVQNSIAVRNARLAAFEATVGTSAVMKIRTGAQPATCATADSGTVLATLSLPADWLGTPTAGVVAKYGTWEDTAADASGTAGHYRIYASDGTTCHEQGSVSLTGGGGDLALDSVTFTAGQAFSITGYSKTAGNA